MGKYDESYLQFALDKLHRNPGKDDAFHCILIQIILELQRINKTLENIADRMNQFK